MNKQESAKSKTDWSRFDAMSDDEAHAAALSDPDNLPWTDEQLAKVKRRPIPLAFRIRRKLQLSQEQFASAIHIPVGTLRDWEQYRCEPDAAALAYLEVIDAAPDLVREVLAGNASAQKDEKPSRQAKQLSGNPRAAQHGQRNQ